MSISKEKGQAWNLTKEGKEFKVRQTKAIWEKRKPIKMNCAYCHKEFEKHSTRGLLNKYCCQKCTQKGGFADGSLAAKTNCTVCNKEYIYKKWKPKKTCSRACQSKRHKAFYDKTYNRINTQENVLI